MTPEERKKVYSRGQLSRLLGITEPAIISSVDRPGKLKPRKVDGRVWYDRAEANAFALEFKRQRAPKSPKLASLKQKLARGKLAAKVFAMLEEKPPRTFVEIVIATEADPDDVRELVAEHGLTCEQKAEMRRQAREEEERLKEERRIERQRQREDHHARRLRAIRESYGMPGGFGPPPVPRPLAPPAAPVPLVPTPVDDSNAGA